MLAFFRLAPFFLLALAGLFLWHHVPSVSHTNAQPAIPPCRTVFLAGDMPEESLVRLGASVAARAGAMLLMDSAKLTPYLKHFLQAWKPDTVVAVGSFPEKDTTQLSTRLGVPVKCILPVPQIGGACPAWKEVLHCTSVVVATPAQPRGTYLQAATLAGVMKAPLWVLSNDAGNEDGLRKFTRQVKAKRLIVVDPKSRFHHTIPGVKLTRLRQDTPIQQSYLKTLRTDSPVETVVVANPFDNTVERGSMSALAPWLAVQKHAGLLLTNEAGTNTASLVEKSVRRASLSYVDALILLGNHKAVGIEHRPNPIPGDKDKLIEMEPLTPQGTAPHTYAVGRLFHEDRAVVTLMLARQRLMSEQTGPHRALVASNPGGGLPLLETFSRNTVKELRNAGYEVDDLFGKDLKGPVLRKTIPGHDIFLWEGHHNTLVKEWGFTTWDEPLSPTFVFLQSCLALQDQKVQPLMSRGAFAVVGTSTRTYSGSGGAFSLSYFNSLLYDNQTLGGALRQSKNFLLAYIKLKQKRLGEEASRTGANQRAAWAFTLWGDPTFKLPKPTTPTNSRTTVRHTVTGDTIRITVPKVRHDKVISDRFVVSMPPNARLAGLLRKTREKDGQPLVPFVFAEVKIPNPGNGTPRLKSTISSRDWVFLWDRRRKTGYLLVIPRREDRTELRFRIEWPNTTVVRKPSESDSES